MTGPWRRRSARSRQVQALARSTPGPLIPTNTVPTAWPSCGSDRHPRGQPTPSHAQARAGARAMATATSRSAAPRSSSS
ncbi:hypothetical protein QJS66_06555 [Kocuria rhizophila]|nr:hypothetical protein QJS66_06555 [Kocuria rhizophila]